MGKEDKKESFLNNLGRATRRGVRQCRKCGTLNGTRGYSCKNKSCDVIFKDAGEKKKLSTEACKISTGSDFQIFSVRVRDKGPDYRAFVQVMENNSNSFSNPFESNNTLGEQFSTNGRTSSLMGNSMDGSNSTQPSFSNSFDPLTDILLDNALSSTSNSQPQNERVAHCYVESCNKNRQTRPPRAFCSHVKAVTHCYKNSEPVMLKSSVLNSMNIPQTLKTEIWQLATATPGPLVQRVSKNIMVVKCQIDDLNPLGFLHFNFQSTKNLKDNFDCGKYFCSCRSFKASSGVKPSNNNSVKSPITKSCVHFFACIVALASHASLASEFSQYISLVTGESKYARKLNQNGLIGIDDIASTVKIHVTDEGGNGEDSAPAYIRVSETPSSGEDDNTRERSFLILNDRSDPNCQVEVEVLQDESFLHALERQNSGNIDENDGSLRRNIDHKLEIKLHAVDEMGLCSTSAVTNESTQLTSSSNSQSKDCVSSAAIATSALLTLQDTPQKKTSPGKRAIAPMYNKQTRQTPASILVENNPTFSFNEWLGVVNEKINHSLQYGHVGTLPPLTFNINKAFYDILDQRITYIGRKKVDVFETVLPHPDSPSQKLKMVTWRIHNVFHLEYLLSNSYVSLQTTRTFLLNRNGTYQPYEPLDPLSNAESSSSGNTAANNQQAIRPQEFKTVLKVGGSNYPGACKRSPFIIEWIANVLPLSRMGELKLKYEYEHVHNGKVLRNISFKDIASQLAQNKTKGANKDRNVPILPNTMAVAPSGSSPTGLKAALNKNGLTPIAPKLTVMDEKTLIDMLNRDTIGDTDSYSSFLL